MPIDIATGEVELDREDFVLPGRVPLRWTRRFRSRLLQASTLLAPGWTTTVFASLKRINKDWHFTTPEGDLHVFEDPEDRIVKGHPNILLGAFLELKRIGNRLLITQWDVDSDDVQRFFFTAHGVSDDLTLSLESIENVSGDGLDLTWDVSGRIAKIRQRVENRTILINYDPSRGHDSAPRVSIASVALSTHTGLATLVTYEYDASGRLTAAIDRRGLANRYEYDAYSRVKREILKDGAVYFYEYDTSGRCIHFSGLDHYNEKTLTFLDSTNKTLVKNSYGATSVFERTAAGQITSEVIAGGQAGRTHFDEHHRLVALSDPNGATTTFTYDSKGNRDSITDPLGHTYTFTFNDHHQALTLTDPLGNIWRREYDDRQRLTSTVTPLGQRWMISYDVDGNPATITNPLGTRRYQRFSNGLPVALTDWMGHITQFKWDDYGRLVGRIGPVGERTSFRYDAAGNLIEVQLPDGATLHADYDNSGNMASFTDAGGRTTHLRYGPCRRLLERVDAFGRTIRYCWGTEPNHLNAIVNEMGESYRYVRNERGRVIRERSYDGRERSFDYDAGGRCVVFTDGNGEKIRFERDAVGRVLKETLADGAVTMFEYDGLGRTISAVNSDMALTFEYDEAGRLTKEGQGAEWVRTEYDAVGHVTRTQTSLGHDVVYDRDDNGRVRTISTAVGRALTFEFDARGLEIARDMPGGLRLEQEFDLLGRLLEQGVGWRVDTRSRGLLRESAVVRRSYRYDADGLLLSVKDRAWGVIDYSYDPADRLLSALHNQGLNEHFEYDATDNITHAGRDGRSTYSDSRTYDNGNRLLYSGAARYKYDAAGRLVCRTEAGDDGEATSWQFFWGGRGELRRIQRPDGREFTYKYDAFGRRIEKRDAGESRRFLWNGDQIIQEVPSRGAAAAWIMAPGTFVPVAKIQNGELYAVITDHLGTPRELLDRGGRIVWTASYEAWGQAKPSETSLVDCPIRFQGQWYDDESGLHYSRFRYYDPSAARFISGDPIGLLGGTNEYSYAPNPVNWVDPLGLASQPGCADTADGDEKQYFIEDGVRRAVAARERGETTIPAIIHEPGKPPVRVDIPLDQLNSPKPVVPRDQRMVNALMQPSPPPPISVSPMPGPVPSVPLADVKLVRARP
ncbi:MAG TPA: RHS repeat-associated core domain-containing protein [Vicinamibacterales bacterium]|nr:RHS repeat-associated core domain-containing protein [Vicinamibacterales bacterium]